MRGARLSPVSPRRSLPLAAALLAVVLTSNSAHASEPPPSPEVVPWSFLDRNGRWRPFRATYTDWFSPSQRTPHYTRALGEAALLVGIGTAYYWVDPLANAADWDFPTLADKLSFHAVRFDNNLHTTNHILHPLAGSSVYGFSRVNGLTVPEAFGYAAASSIFWEYVLEFREQVSINDMVFTPLGGMAMGEFFFKLGDYLNSAPGGGSWPNELAATTLGLPRHLHDALDNPYRPIALPADRLGFSSAYWHRFTLGYGLSEVGNDANVTSTLHSMEMSAEIAAMPGLLRPGRFSTSFSDANFVDMSWRMGFGDIGLQEVDLWFSAALAGFYEQDFRAAGRDGLSGKATLLALSSAFRYADKHLVGRQDRFAMAHLLGPQARLWLGLDDLLATFQWSMHVDFAAIHPVAFDDWQTRHDTAGLKTVLQRQSYSFALGWSTRGRMRFDLHGVEAGTSVSYGFYDSIEGLDRQQAEVTRDLNTLDHILELDAFVGYAPRTTPVLLRVTTGEVRRWGSMDGDKSDWTDRRLTISAGLSF